MSALGAYTQDNRSKLNVNISAKAGEDSDHHQLNQLNVENGSKKKRNARCNPCCCCRGQNSDDELRASAQAAFKAVQEKGAVVSSNTDERASQTESIEMENKETITNSPVSSAESSYSPAFKHFKTPSFGPKANKSDDDDDDDDSDDLESTNADFRPPTSKLDLAGNDKKELELLQRKRSGDLVDDEDSLVETLQLTKPDRVRISNDSGVEKSVSQDEQVLSSDPKVAACFGCQKISSFSWPLKKP